METHLPILQKNLQPNFSQYSWAKTKKLHTHNKTNKQTQLG